MTTYSSRNNVPGAMRAASVRIAGHMIRVGETAQAGIPNGGPKGFEPVASNACRH